MGKIFAVWTFYPQNDPLYVCALSVEQSSLVRFLSFHEQHFRRYNYCLLFESGQCLGVSFMVAAFILDAGMQMEQCIYSLLIN